MVVQVGGGYPQLEILVLGALAALVFIALFLFVAYPHLSKRRFGNRRWAGNRQWAGPPPQKVVRLEPTVGDASDQLRHVMGASFFKKKIMSKAEYRVFRIVEAEVQQLSNGCRVLSQTSLGEILGSDNQMAFASINSKRVDILVIAANGEPVAAVEYQGAAHYQGTAAARDAVKREALRKAGVQFLEIVESHSPDEISNMVRKVFGQPARTAGDRGLANPAVG